MSKGIFSVYHRIPKPIKINTAMPSVLIVDDEEAIRKNVERLLSLEGFEVATAPNGQHGLVIARSMLPDIIITDINMPVMDGFEMLAAIRELPELSTAAVIMLTAADDRSNMRKGMRLGADDYLTKPFKREELLEAIAAQQQRVARFTQAKEYAVSHAVQAAVSSSESRMREMFTQHYKRDALAQTMPPNLFARPSLAHTMPQVLASAVATPNARIGTSTQKKANMVASVLFADIRNFTTMAERLSAQELAAMLSHYFDRACQPVLAHGGSYLKLMGDGLMVLFEDHPTDPSAMPHARRALSAALALEQVALDFRAWIRAHVGARGLPEFAIGIGVHCGQVSLGRLGTGESAETTPLGDSVNIAARLQSASKELGWTIACSRDVVGLAGALVRTGREQVVSIRGRDAPVAACELMGLQRLPSASVNTNTASSVDFHLTLSGSNAGHASILAAVHENSQQTARAAKDALKDSLWSLQSGTFNALNSHRFKGYEVVKKLGEGGMSDVFLARFDNNHTRRGQEVVLKVLHTNLQSDPDMMRRFIQEYAILASIEHHHIARIYDQGFSDDYAYIAMEYLSGGDLKSEIAKRPQQPRVLDLLRQIVSALSKIHSLGLVYRDLKPDNLMFRGSGELVLVDFGIVKSVRTDTNALVKTLHGQIVGTPYYVSPEQAASKEVTNRSDFYSLGVMVYELLTGEKPYLADTLDALLARHLYGQVPTLPKAHAAFQPLLSKLMAKSPDDRPSDCSAIWHNLDALSAA